jgi:hypothetical protein
MSRNGGWLHQWLAAPLLPFAQQPHCKMSLTTLTTAPTEGDFTPLSEHHEQTPGSFFAGKPVLHLQAPASKLQVSKEDLEANEAVKALVATTDDAAVDAEGLVEIQDIDVWVTSRYAKHSIHSSYNFRFAHT